MFCTRQKESVDFCQLLDSRKCIYVLHHPTIDKNCSYLSISIKVGGSERKSTHGSKYKYEKSELIKIDTLEEYSLQIKMDELRSTLIQECIQQNHKKIILRQPDVSADETQKLKLLYETLMRLFASLAQDLLEKKKVMTIILLNWTNLDKKVMDKVNKEIRESQPKNQEHQSLLMTDLREESPKTRFKDK